MFQPKPTAADTQWFVHDRFGMFIHWNPYVLSGRGQRDEWIPQVIPTSLEEYEAERRRYFDRFDPDLFDPREWARVARETGMKYVVITTKHHEGYCLWDSKLSDYTAAKSTARRDLLRELIEVFRAEDIRIGLYFSLIDWYHPEFPIDPLHPLAGLPNAEELNRTRDNRKYVEFMHGQVRELLTEYGKIDLLWFDYSYPQLEQGGLRGKGHQDWQSEELLKLIRELQPHVLVNNRLDLPAEYADFHTPEQFLPTEWPHARMQDGSMQPVVWEACHTLSGAWGYHRDEATWKSPDMLIRLLVDAASKGGNFIMNVGPTGRGVFDQRALNSLGIYAEWMRWHARSIYGCTQSEFTAPTDMRYTQNGKRLYVHVFAWPFKELHLPGLAGKVEYAQLLNDASEIHFKESGESFLNAALEAETPENALTLQLPVLKPDVTVPVIELFLKDNIG